MSDFVSDLLAFIDASPTAWHAVREAERRLSAAGFTRIDEGDPWKLERGGKHYVTRSDATVIAFIAGEGNVATEGFRILGAHTDSPNLRVKPAGTYSRAGCTQLGVEVYGGVLYHTWLDRDLIVAGRVAYKDGSSATPKIALVRSKTALARVASLAIHLQRAVNTEGLVLNAQQHLPPLIGLDRLGELDTRMLLERLASDSGEGFSAKDVLSFDLALADAAPSARFGFRDDFISAPRLDNLAMSHASLSAIVESAKTSHARTRVIALFDHEEVGSTSAHGADSPILRHVLERLVRAAGATEGDAYNRAAHRSLFVSADMAHGVHPNYADKHEPQHAPVLGGGPVIKSNSNQRYATDAVTGSHFVLACERAEVVPQWFLARTDLACGSTIGPITAGQLGMPCVDVGSPMLSMHSAREMMAARDVEPMIRVFRQVLDG